MNQQIIKDINTKIATYLGLTSDKLGFYSANDLRKVGIPFPQYMGNGTNDLQFQSSLDLITIAVEKIEKELGYFMLCFPFTDDETGGLTGEYYCSFIYQSVNINEKAYIDVTGCQSRKEAIFYAIGAFLDKYYSQEEKNRRINEKQGEIMSDIDRHLLIIWTQIGCDNPNNADDIIAFIFDDICDTAEEVNSGTVATGFRRWIEAQQK